MTMKLQGNRWNAGTVFALLAALLLSPAILSQEKAIEAEESEVVETDEDNAPEAPPEDEPAAPFFPPNPAEMEAGNEGIESGAPGAGLDPALIQDMLRNSQPGGPAGPDAPGAPEGPGGSGIFGKMLDLFRGGEEDVEGLTDEDGPQDQNYQRIKAFERSAIRNIEKKRVTEAKKNITDLITLKPYEADYHFALGLCFRVESRWEDTLKKYQDVLDLGGPKPLVHLLMAEAQAAKGDKEKVFQHLKEAAVGGRNIIHDVQNLPHLQQYQLDTEFIKLALSLERYEISSKKSQDPMTNPFPMQSIDQGPGPDLKRFEPQALTPEEQEKLLSDARKAYDRVLWYIKLEDEQKAMENYQQLRGIIEKKDLITIPKINNDFSLLVSRMEGLESSIEDIRLRYYYKQAIDLLKRMEEAFLETEYNRVETTFVEVQKVAKEMERTSARFKPIAEQIVRRGENWVQRMKIRREFEANKPSIQGIIISADTKKTIVNNRIVEQGERYGEFQVLKVENNRITFRYKGEDIPLVFRRY